MQREIPHPFWINIFKYVSFKFSVHTTFFIIKYTIEQQCKTNSEYYNEWYDVVSYKLCLTRNTGVFPTKTERERVKGKVRIRKRHTEIAWEALFLIRLWNVDSICWYIKMCFKYTCQAQNTLC